MANIFCLLGLHRKEVEQKFYPSITAKRVTKVEAIITCKNCTMRVVDRWFDIENEKPKKVNISYET